MRASLLIRLALLALLVPLITAGSCSAGNTRPVLPGAGIPVHTVTVRQVYVSIPAKLTEHCPIAEGPLADAPLVARQRRGAINGCNAQLDEIAAIQGTPVDPPASTPPAKSKPAR